MNLNKTRHLLFLLLIAFLLVGWCLPARAAKPADESQKAMELLSLGKTSSATKRVSTKINSIKKESTVQDISRISSLEVSQMGESLRLVLHSNKKFQIHAARMSNPSRILLDMNPVQFGSSVKNKDVGFMGVSQLRVGQRSKTEARIVLDLTEPVTFDLVPSGDSAVLWIHPAQKKSQIVSRSTSHPRIEDNTPGGGESNIKDPAVVSEVTASESAEGVSVRIRTNRPVSPKTLWIHNPLRLAVDIPDSIVSDVVKNPSVSSPLLSEIRVGQMKTTSRIVFEPTSRTRYNLRTDDEGIVIDFMPPTPVTSGSGNLSGLKITIDPGHGGYQPGARGCGLVEKDINLQNALKVYDALRQAGAEVTLTRTDDTYVSLDERVDIAERAGSDIFISFHCNSCGTSNLRHGTELYYCNDNSKDLATVMEKTIVPKLGTRYGGVFQRRFLVVRKSKMPAILVEVGYINDTGDAAKLSDPNFQEQLAQAVVEAVEIYKNSNPITSNSSE